MTPQQAIQILASVDAAEPAKRQATINTIVRSCPQWVLQVASSVAKKQKALEAKIDHMSAIVMSLAKLMNVDLSSIQPMVSVETEAPEPVAQQASPVSSARSTRGPEGRVSANGEPMTPEQAAAEDAMDAALANGVDNSEGPGRTPYAAG